MTANYSRTYQRRRHPVEVMLLGLFLFSLWSATLPVPSFLASPDRPQELRELQFLPHTVPFESRGKLLDYHFKPGIAGQSDILPVGCADICSLSFPRVAEATLLPEHLVFTQVTASDI